MKKIAIILIVLPFIVSCQALKQNICGDIKCTDTLQVKLYDTIEVPHHTYDTVKTFVSKQYRDTIPIFKGTKIFIGSSIDSLSSDDSVRYFSFEMYNYGNIDYDPTDDKYYNMIFDLEINKIIMYSDTTKLGSIKSQGSRYFNFHFPVKWFKNHLNSEWDYHYRITLKDNSNKIIDAFYPRAINPKLPEKRWDEVTKDSIIYWARPVIIDTTITLKRPVYAYKDSLIFIDDIIGCRIYSHIMYGGNKVYSFVADTCNKRLYSGTGMNDNNTQGISALILKAVTHDLDSPTMQIFVNDSLIDRVGFDQPDSTYIYLITKSFSDIKSLTFKSSGNVVIYSAILNNIDLLSNQSTISGNAIKNSKGNYIFTKKETSFLFANWKFNGDFSDVSGRFPLNVNDPASMMIEENAPEGSGFISVNGNTLEVDPIPLPVPDKFSMSFWMRTFNENSDSRPVFGNSKVYYPDGYILYMIETTKMMKFVTSDGSSESRKYIMTMDNSWDAGKWTNFIITGNRSTGEGKFYVNGVDKTRASSTGLFSSFKNDQPLYIGRSSENSKCYCNLDDIRIYSKILTPDEVSKVFNKQDILNETTEENYLKITLP